MSVSAVAARVVFFCAAASTLFAAMPAEAQPLGVEFRVNTYTSYFKGFPRGHGGLHRQLRDRLAELL